MREESDGTHADPESVLGIEAETVLPSEVLGADGCVEDRFIGELAGRLRRATPPDQSRSCRESNLREGRTTS